MPEDDQSQQSPEDWAPRPRDDTDEAFRLGARFDLGGLEQTTWTGESGTLSSCGGLLAWAAAIGGLIAWFSTPRTPTAAIAVIAPAGSLFLLGLLLRRLGLPGSTVRRRLYWYSDGVVELVHDQPEPRVVRWADVETVSISYSEGDDDTPPAPVGCILRGRAGAELADLGYYPEWVLRALIAEAVRAMAARLVPPLIAIYESGEPVTFGEACIDRAGITADPSSGGLIPWSDIRSVTLMYSTPHTTSGPPVIKYIQISRHTAKTDTGIAVVGVPNGIFLPHLIVYAAARNGVPVDTYPRKLPYPLAVPPGSGLPGVAQAGFLRYAAILPMVGCRLLRHCRVMAHPKALGRDALVRTAHAGLTGRSAVRAYRWWLPRYVRR